MDDFPTKFLRGEIFGKNLENNLYPVEIFIKACLYELLKKQSSDDFLKQGGFLMESL